MFFYYYSCFTEYSTKKIWNFWTVQAVGCYDGPSSPASLVWYPGVFITLSEPIYDYMTLGEKTESEQISQLFLNTVY